MESEILYCTFEDFQRHYFPFVPHKFDAERHYRGLQTHPTSYVPVEKICQCLEGIVIPGRRHNHLRYRHTVTPNADNSNHGISGNACLSDDDDGGAGNIPTTSITVPLDFKTNSDASNTTLNEIPIVKACVHIMNNDARRRFMFAISVEFNMMTLWYFSRSHSVRSESVDVLKDPSTFVSVLMSLVFATREELGFDPYIQLYGSDRYIYRVNKKFFMTIRGIWEPNYHPYLIHGRTRTYVVLEVERLNNGRFEVKDKTEIVFKDSWIEQDASTEGQNQKSLFNDIEDFGKRSNWRTDPRLHMFVQMQRLEDLAELEDLLKDQKYRELFLCVQDEFVSDIYFKAVAPTSYYPIRTEVTSPDKNIRYAPVRRCFNTFNHYCTLVHRLPTIGDAIHVLSECVTALLLMYCAGWVHRDISAGNVMAIHQNAQWRVKLADFKYAKKFSSQNEGLIERPAIPMTMYFTPCEIVAQKYWAIQEIKLSNIFPERWIHDSVPKLMRVRYNFHHDLESIYWILLWIITDRVQNRNKKSSEFANRVFNYMLGPREQIQMDVGILNHDKAKAMSESVYQVLCNCLVPELGKDVACVMDNIRDKLYSDAMIRGANGYAKLNGNGNGNGGGSGSGDWDDCDSYSMIHYLFSVAFKDVHTLERGKPWSFVELQRSANVVTPTTTRHLGLPDTEMILGSTPQAAPIPSIPPNHQQQARPMSSRQRRKMKRRRSESRSRNDHNTFDKLAQTTTDKLAKLSINSSNTGPSSSTSSTTVHHHRSKRTRFGERRGTRELVPTATRVEEWQ